MEELTRRMEIRLDEIENSAEAFLLAVARKDKNVNKIADTMLRALTRCYDIPASESLVKNAVDIATQYINDCVDKDELSEMLKDEYYHDICHARNLLDSIEYELTKQFVICDPFIELSNDDDVEGRLCCNTEHMLCAKVCPFR